MIAIGERRLLRFAAIFLPLLSILAWPYPFLGRAYRFVVCRAINDMVMNSTDTPRVARLVPDPRTGFEWHGVVAVWDQNANSVQEQFPVDIHQTFYLPTVVFAVLTIAGKFTWGGRQVPLKLLVGIVLFQLRPILPFIARERTVVGLTHDGLFDLILLLVNKSLVAPLGMAFALPLLLWFLLFRSSLYGTNRAT